jgi:hypothetical protein
MAHGLGDHARDASISRLLRMTRINALHAMARRIDYSGDAVHRVRRALTRRTVSLRTRCRIGEGG